MRIDFTKMHGVGNDFVVFDAPPGKPMLTGEQFRRLVGTSPAAYRRAFRSRQ